MQGIAIVCDLKRSRALRNRAAFASQLASCLASLNKDYRSQVHAPFEVQKGIDEFAAFLKPRAPVGDVLLALWTGLHPHPVRVALAGGPADDLGQGASPSVTGFDGPAFHQAADRLLDLSPEGRLLGFAPGSTADRMLEDMGNLLHLAVLSWTRRQLEVFLRFAQGEAQKEMAAAFGVTQPTVSATLQRLNARFIRTAMADWAAAMRAVRWSRA